jgi:hypothetical protein
MFDPFKMWDEMLDIYQETVMGNKDERDVDTLWVTREIPADLEDEFNALVDNLLAKRGYDPSDFDTEDE